MCKAVEDSDATPDPSPQDVGDQEVDAAALHLTALTHPYSTQRHDQHQEHRHKNHQDRQQNTSIPLNKQIKTTMNIVAVFNSSPFNKEIIATMNMVPIKAFFHGLWLM